MNDTIGIQTADGRMFPLFERSFRGKKRVQLTKIADQQDSIEVNLFIGEGQEMDNAVQIAALQLDDLGASGRKTLDIVLEIGIDMGGDLNAEISESLSGRRDGATVRLGAGNRTKRKDAASKAQTASIDAADASAGESTADRASVSKDTPYRLGLDPEISYDSTAKVVLDRSERRLRRRRRITTTLAAIGFLLLGLIILAVALYFIFENFRNPEVPPLRVGLG